MGIKNYDVKKDKLLKDQDCKCFTCGKSFNSRNEVQLAHMVIKSVANIKIYGLEVIDHVDNLKATHSDSCNSGVIINRATNPIKAAEHLDNIIQKIKEQEKMENEKWII